MNTMTFTQTADFLFARRAKGMKLGLENIRRFLDRLHHPETRFASIHIAGTNGKGSTAAILESVLREAGFRTGLYTSPHLVDMRERIQIRGEHITEQSVVNFINTFRQDIEDTQVTFFEILTAMAFHHFAQKKVEIAVLETGLGGRLDATTTVTPLLTLITEIGMDHTHILGDSLEAIAGEKAGILKSGVPCITRNTNPEVRKVLSKIAGKLKVPISFTENLTESSHLMSTEEGSRFDIRTPGAAYRDLHLRLLGAHQVANSKLALLAVDTLNELGLQIPEQAVRRGLQNVRWRGRLDLLQKNPGLLLDSAHNPMGMESLVETIRSVFSYKRLILVFGVLADKAYDTMIRQIAPLADKIILTKPLSDRALDPEKLVALIPDKREHTEVIPNIEKAWNRAVQWAAPEDLVCGAGSIYFIGEVLRIRDRHEKTSSI
jgi:dihydrofolate synthase/folylpolyglutamate synthase